jgi:hypothetical protein
MPANRNPPPRSRRTFVVRVRLTAAEHRFLVRTAKKYRRTISNLIRDRCCPGFGETK